MSAFGLFIFWGSLLSSIVLSIPALVLLVQALAACWARSRQAQINAVLSSGPDRSIRLAVVMPAHNEAMGITEAIHGVLPQLHANDRLVVVADNCIDGTAAAARAAGAEVVERYDSHLRGKGYALNFGVRHLDANGRPDVVIIVDADCIVSPGALRALAATCIAQGRPVQALYRMRSPEGAGLKTRIAELAWVVKNHVRPLGAAILHAPCQLMGTGMAFPWTVIRTARLASGHIVEDLQLGLDLAASGVPPVFLPSARVSSRFPLQSEGAVSQRTRWEHGHLSVIVSRAPRLLWQALRRGQGPLLAMVLDLCVPPLASLVLMLVIGCLLGGLVGIGLGLWLPAWMAGGAMAALAVSVVLSWRLFAKDVVATRELMSVPAYVFGKVPLYLRFLLKLTPLEWVKTPRDPVSKVSK